MWGQGSQENRPQARGEEGCRQRVQLMQILRDMEEHVYISMCLESGVGNYNRSSRAQGEVGGLCRQELVYEVCLAEEFGLYLKGSEQ